MKVWVLVSEAGGVTDVVRVFTSHSLARAALVEWAHENKADLENDSDLAERGDGYTTARLEECEVEGPPGPSASQGP